MHVCVYACVCVCVCVRVCCVSQAIMHLLCCLRVLGLLALLLSVRLCSVWSSGSRP